MLEFSKKTITQIAHSLREKEFSAFELAVFYLKQIKEKDQDIGAFLEINEERVLARAKEVDRRISVGEKLPLLAGIPCAIKDNILVKGFNCTAGSRLLENYRAAYQATVVKKLEKAGALILGKTNLDEFAMGSSTEHSAFKTTKNPSDLTRVPGGSSGGSAAAVASSQSVFALGSDTGGSIRQPASFCGVVGLKPTYGAVSRYGLIAFGSSLDQIGPLAKNVKDIEIVYNTIKGKDKKDSTSSDFEAETKNTASLKDIKLSDCRVGIPKEYFSKGLEKNVKDAVQGAVKKIEKSGVKIKEISLPNSSYGLPCYYIIAVSEASANLARFDGLRYGRTKNKQQETSNKSLLEDYLTARSNGFGEEVKRRIILGTFCLSSGYYDAYYLRAQKVRALIKNDFTEAFKEVDFILAPVSPFPAFKIGEKMDDPLQMYLADIYTVNINLAGLPGLSLPCSVGNNLPIGLQIIGDRFSDSRLLNFAKQVENII